MSAPQFITDDKGTKLSVILSIEEYERIMEELDELDDIKLFDAAIADEEKAIPINEAFAIIEKNRK